MVVVYVLRGSFPTVQERIDWQYSCTGVLYRGGLRSDVITHENTT